jgi:transcriptional regulator with PAS, ATPase and Fis domain
VRIVGATNQDLQELILQGRFRDDLLYRINTVTLRVPPLRERKEDLPRLVDHILQTLRVPGATKRTVSPEAMQELLAHSWPGNIRELRNVVERIMMMSAGTVPISREEVLQVLPRGQGSLQAGDLTQLSLEEIERLHIQRVLDTNGGNKTQAAKTLDIDYKTLLAKLKKYRLDT